MGIIFYEDGIEVSKLSFENIYFTLNLVVEVLFHFSSLYVKIHSFGWGYYSFCTYGEAIAKFWQHFTFGAVIPSLGDFSGHIVILEKIRKIDFKNFWVSLRSIFFHLVWIELI